MNDLLFIYLSFGSFMEVIESPDVFFSYLFFSFSFFLSREERIIFSL